MDKEKDGGPAYPVVDAAGFADDHPGMSLRDYFAGQALAGIMSNGWVFPTSTEDTHEQFACLAYTMADAMLKERDK